MSSGPHDANVDISGRGRMFWLPPGGRGNGLDASAWAEIADLLDDEVAVVLPELTAAHISAYLAIPHQRSGSADPAITRRRLWVDSTQYHRAEEVLMRVLARSGHATPSRPPPTTTRPCGPTSPLGDTGEPLNSGDPPSRCRSDRCRE